MRRHKPYPAPPAWLLLVLAAVALVLALAACSPQLARDQIAKDAVLVHHCAPIVRSRWNTSRLYYTVWATPDRAKAWLLLEGFPTEPAKPVAANLTFQQMCPVGD